jgi:hypothetical protein
MKHLVKKLIILALLAAPLFALPVLAEEGSDDSTQNTTKTTDPAESENESEREKMPLSDRLEERMEGKLSAIKQRICEKRVNVIKNIMAKAATQGAKHLEVFNKIATRVEEFYVNKKLSVSNYDALVAEVNAKKAAAQTAIDAVKNNTNFSCDDSNPIGKIDAFNGQVRAMHSALKDYRTSIKNLIVAVKQAAEAAEGSEE